MAERRAEIPAFASVVKQKMKELFDHHVLIYEGCKSEAKELEETIKTVKQENDGLQKEVVILKERNEHLHSENMRLKEDLVNTSTRLSLPCENCRSLMNQLEQQNKLLCTMMERKDQNLGEIIEKYLSKKTREDEAKENQSVCPRQVIDTLSQALSVPQKEEVLVPTQVENNAERKERSGRQQMIGGKTSNVVEKVQNKRKSNELDIAGEASKAGEESKVSPETQKRTGKLTQAGKRRRARYTEETTPENKKKKMSPSAAATCQTNGKLNLEQKESEKTSSSSIHKILAPDTCEVSLCKSPPIVCQTKTELKYTDITRHKPDKDLSVKSKQKENKLLSGEAGPTQSDKQDMGDNRRNKAVSDNIRNKAVSDNTRYRSSDSNNKKDIPDPSAFTVPETLAMDMPESDHESENETDIDATCAKNETETRYRSEANFGKIKPDSKDYSPVMSKKSGKASESTKITKNQKQLGRKCLMKSLLISPPSLSSTPVSTLYPYKDHNNKDLNESITETLPTFLQDIPPEELSSQDDNDEDDSIDGNVIQASPGVIKRKNAKSSKHSFSTVSYESSRSPPNSPVFGGNNNEGSKVGTLISNHRKSIGSPALFDESSHCANKNGHDYTEEDSSLLLAKPMSDMYLPDSNKDKDTSSYSNHDASLNKSKRYRSPLKFTPNMGGEAKVRLTRLTLGSQKSDESLTSPSVISGKLLELTSSEEKSNASPALLRKTKSSGYNNTVQSGISKKVKGRRTPQKVSSQGRSKSRGVVVKGGNNSPMGKLVIEKNPHGKKIQKKMFQTKLNSGLFQGKKSNVVDTIGKAKEFNGKSSAKGHLSLKEQEEMLIEKAKQESLSIGSCKNNECSPVSKRNTRNNACSSLSKDESLFTSTPAFSNDDGARMSLVTSPIAMDTQAERRKIHTLRYHEDGSSTIQKEDHNSELIFKKPFLPLTPSRRNSIEEAERNETLRRSPRLKEMMSDNREGKASDNRKSVNSKHTSARRLVMNTKNKEMMEDSGLEELSLGDLNGTLDPHFNMSEFDTLPDGKIEARTHKDTSRVPANRNSSKGHIQPINMKKSADNYKSSDTKEKKGKRHGRQNEEEIDNFSIEGQGECQEDFSERSAVFGPVSLKPALTTKQEYMLNSEDAAVEESGHMSKGDHTKDSRKVAEDIDCSFDRIPKAADPCDYKYVDVVRRRAERDKLDAYVCIECDRYFNGMDISDDEKQKRMRAVCRHKAKFAPPDTPEHYWSVGFPDTQECNDRGYLNVTQAKPSRFRRRKPLKQLSKTESKVSGADNTSDISD